MLSRKARVVVEDLELFLVWRVVVKPAGPIRRIRRVFVPAEEPVRSGHGGGVWFRLPGAGSLPVPFGNGMTPSHKPQYRAWTEAETLRLQELAGDMPFLMVCQQFNGWAVRNGIPPRSTSSLEKRLRRLGTSRRTHGSWLCVGDVARMLGKNRSTVLLWATNGWIRHHKAGSCSSVSRDDLIRLARERPRLYAGADRSNLLLLLEDEDLVTEILRQFPRRYCATGRGRRVRWMDTGQEFPTCRAAAKAANLHYTSVSKAIREGRPAAGLRFEAID